MLLENSAERLPLPPAVHELGIFADVHLTPEGNMAVPATLETHLFGKYSGSELIFSTEMDESDASFLQQIDELDHVHSSLVLHLHHPHKALN